MQLVDEMSGFHNAINILKNFHDTHVSFALTLDLISGLPEFYLDGMVIIFILLLLEVSPCSWGWGPPHSFITNDFYCSIICPDES